MVPAYKASVHMHRKDVRKMVKKKIKLEIIFLHTRDFYLFCVQQKKKKNKKFLLEGPDGVHRVSSWNVDIS